MRVKGSNGDPKDLHPHSSVPEWWWAERCYVRLKQLPCSPITPKLLKLQVPQLISTQQLITEYLLWARHGWGMGDTLQSQARHSPCVSRTETIKGPQANDN